VANIPAEDESPSVLGAGCGKPPMPTEADRKEAFLLLWIERFVELGVPEHVARAEFDAAPWDDIKDMDPALAADTAMEVWDVE
jgi:hypothetical protein